MIEDIQNNTIIICENKYKKYILKKMSQEHIFLNIKFFTKKEFFKEYLFGYNEKAIYYVVDKYNLKIDIAKMYLNNLYYITNNKTYKSNKLNFLVKLKNELASNNLLEYNYEFKNYIKNYQILVIGYPYLENYELAVFNEVNAKIIKDKALYKIKKVFEFDKLENEINYVAKSICELLKKGIDINKIKIMGINEEYYNELERIFKFYNIPIKLPKNNTLFSNYITKIFLNSYNSDITKSIDSIKNLNSDIVNKIINICNKYAFIDDYLKVKELIIDDLKKTEIDNYKLKNYIEIINIEDIVTDEYIFLMNFNTGNIPKTIKDEFYITDNIKHEINENSVIEINKLTKEFIINKINSIKNLVITYKIRSGKGEYYPSSLINELNLEIERIENNILQSYSLLNDKLEYAKLEDDYLKYGNVSTNYLIYKNNLKDIAYRTYDNSYKKIDNNMLKEYLNNKLTLSYSSLNNYNKCAFRYYISNILKLDKYEETFETFIGSIFHDILEKCFINKLEVEKEINEYINNSARTITIKERFFINKLIEDIKYVIDVLNKQKECISLDKEMYEKNIVIDKSKDIRVEFIGFIDKILYKENMDNTLISIIDYKTGFIDIDLKYVPYGLSLQLPIYLYLVKKSNIFKNPKFVGFYLQYILDKDIVRDTKKTYDEKRWDNLKLMGYSTSDIHSLVELDNSYENSTLIKGMKVKNDGNFSSYTKILTDDEIDKLILLTEKNIDESITKILEADFTINPKKIGYENDVGCKYCKFKDLCFKKENDYVILEDIKNLDFLRGDEDA